MAESKTRCKSCPHPGHFPGKCEGKMSNAYGGFPFPCPCLGPKNTMTLQEARDHLGRRARGMNKFGAKKVTDGGITFDSKAEHARYLSLKAEEFRGRIEALRVHVPYPLMVNGQKVCDYVADFSYRRVDGDTRTHVLEDVKGLRKGSAWAVFRLKARLFEAIHKYEIEVYPPITKKPRRKRTLEGR